MEPPFTAEARFHEEPHAVQLVTTAAGLRVAVERLGDGRLWSGVFSSARISELTSKTGTPRSLPSFQAMLRAALDKSTPSVSLAFLTASELEARKRSASPAASSAFAASDKRYLILSLLPEFASQRLHFPLALAPEETPAVRPSAALARSLERREAGGSSAELETLRAAHAALQRRAAAQVAALSAELAARSEGERTWRLRYQQARAETETLQRRLRATEARVGLHGTARSANFVYTVRSASAHSSRSVGASPLRDGRPPSAPRGRPALPPARFDPSAWAAERRARDASLRSGSHSARSVSPSRSWGSLSERAGSPRPIWRPGGGSYVPAPLPPMRAPSPARSQSPGAAMREVKARLSVFTRPTAAAARDYRFGSGASSPRREGRGGWEGRPLAGAPAAAGAEDSEAAIADIDARLQKLSAFLRQAKEDMN